jgi:protein TonB
VYYRRDKSSRAAMDIRRWDVLKENTMPVAVKSPVLALGLVIFVAGCASPPTAEIDAARAAVDRATTDRADQYAAESLRAAQDARAALDAEVKTQDGKWFKSYDRTRELAVAAKAAGDKAAADAVAGKAKADAVADKAKADASAARAKVDSEAASAKARIGAVPVIRDASQIAPLVKIKDVTPVYPPLAQSGRVSGPVTIEATIGPDGKVADAKVVGSIPLLDQAALDAVRQWEYSPPLRNGKPVSIVMTVTVNFTRP